MFEDTRLKIFLKLAECGNFTAASRELGISQPAVSQNIAEIERLAGQPLFDRTRAGVTLTPQGELFKKFALKIIADYADLNAIFMNYDSFAEYVSKYEDLSSDPLFKIVSQL